MTIFPGELSDAELIADTAQRFDSRPDIGPISGILERLARYLGGNPVKYFTVSSPNFSTPNVLPDEPRARVAVIQVIGNPCFYRTDGSVPATSSEQTLQVGDIITLTGQQTIKGFVFQAVSISASTLAVNYYD